MQFILTFTLSPATQEAAIARFLETGGQPPAGVTLRGRWTRLDLCGGVVLLESEDPHALAAFARAWTDVAELTLSPVLEDRELAAVLRHARPAPARRDERPGGPDLPQAAAIVADQELPDRTPPEAVHGDLRAEAPPSARPARRRRAPRGAAERPEEPPVMPETTPGTTKPPYEEIA